MHSFSRNFIKTGHTTKPVNWYKESYKKNSKGKSTFLCLIFTIISSFDAKYFPNYLLENFFFGIIIQHFFHSSITMHWKKIWRSQMQLYYIEKVHRCTNRHRHTYTHTNIIIIIVARFAAFSILSTVYCLWNLIR